MSKYFFLIWKKSVLNFYIGIIVSNIMSNLNTFINMIWSNRLIKFWVIDWIFQIFCIGCMPYFTNVNYLYFNENDYLSKYYHNIFINKQDSGINITSLMRLLEERFKHIFNNVCWKHACFIDTIFFQGVVQWSIIDLSNQQSQKKDNIIIAIEYVKMFSVVLIFQDFVI